MLEKMIKLIDGLHSKTRANKVPWERTSSKGEFLAAFPNYGVRMWRDYEDRVCLGLYNSEGDVVATVSAADFLNQRGGDMAAVQLNELFHRAQLTAMGADKAVDDILTTLEHLS